MTNCWSEGALRAYLDRELAAEDTRALAAHLAECSACDEVCTELAGRAARVFALLETLPGPELPVRPVPAARPPLSRWLWPGAAVAIAAGLAIASFIVPRKDSAPPVIRTAAPPVSAPAPVREADPPEARREPVARMASAKSRAPKRRADPGADYFVALDDQPIESGVIMRMHIQPGNTQADVVFDPEGRARAIRLVNNKY
jgi:hypothetical protein